MGPLLIYKTNNTTEEKQKEFNDDMLIIGLPIFN